MGSNLKDVVDSGSVYIIAEIGQNHQGNINHAKKLIKKAAEAGVNAVKSQKRHTRTLLTPEEYDRPYDTPNAFADTYGKHRDALELSVEEHLELKQEAENYGLDYFVSPWDPVSASQMNEVGMPLMKIASASITDKETIDAACEGGAPLIFSTGMSTEEEIEQAANWIRNAEINVRCILHCTSTYPAEFNQLNLNYIPVLQEKYSDFIIGFPGETHETIQSNVDFIKNSGIDFYSLKEFWYAPNAPIAAKASQFGLEGFGNKWKHNTMTSQEASTIKLEIFNDINEIKGQNYVAIQGDFLVNSKKNKITNLKPEKRLYPVTNIVTTEAAIHTNLARDLYIVLGDGNSNDGWVVRFYINPLVIWIWIGVVFMFVGGILSIKKSVNKKRIIG